VDKEELREKERLRAKKFREENPERYKEICAKSREKHKEKNKLRRKEQYKDNIEYRRKKGRESAERFKENSPDKLLESTARYRDKNRDVLNNRQRIWRFENKEKAKEYYKKSFYKNPQKVCARQRIYKALIRGKIKRPETCQVCNKKCKLEAHHKDYDKPLEVIWCCKQCHVALHKRKELELNVN